MMELERLHEVEEVVLFSEQKHPATKLWAALKECGMTLHEDTFSLDRPTKPKLPPWQSEAYVEVDIYHQQTQIYEIDQEWNKLELKYLLATQPRAGIIVFAKCVFALADRFALQVEYRGGNVTPDELIAILNRYADELTSDIAEPGSEDLAIVIESTYPRNRL